MPHAGVKPLGFSSPAQLTCQLNTAEWVASADARWSEEPGFPQDGENVSVVLSHSVLLYLFTMAQETNIELQRRVYCLVAKSCLNLL